MPAVQQLHKAGPLTVALFSSDLQGDPSGNSDYDANTQHDDSDSSSDCGSITSGDEYVLAKGRAAKDRAAEGRAAEGRAAKCRAAKGHAADGRAAENRATKAHAAEDVDEEGPHVSSERCACSLDYICSLFKSLCTQGRKFC